MIFTKSDNPRAAEPDDLAGHLRGTHAASVAQVAQSSRTPCAWPQSAVSREDLICVTGSFYLVGEAKAMLSSGQRAAM